MELRGSMKRRSVKSGRDTEQRGKMEQRKMIRKAGREKRMLLWMVLLLTVVFGGAGCMKKTVAAVIELSKSEGEVEIINRRGKELPPEENLHLFHGYMMATQDLSYAWLNLDRARLVKMDEESQIEIEKSGKKLEIIVDRGSLFFHIADPLKEDETLNIRTSSMMVGIRGTCGWVEVLEGGETMYVYLLEGKVSCESDGRQEMVRAGEMARINKDEEIAVSLFRVEDIPEFVIKELEADEELCEAIQEDSGLDVQNIPESPDGSELPEESVAQADYVTALEEYRVIIGRASSYQYDTFIAPPDSYQYALVKMQAQDTVPTLLLKQVTPEYIDSMRIFQYDPASGIVHQPEKTLNEGVASAGGYRGTLGMARDGYGLVLAEWSSGTGAADVARVTLNGESLNLDILWSGRIDQCPEEFRSLAIEWYSTRDLDALGHWTPGTEMNSDGTGGTNQTDTGLNETSEAETPAPETTAAETIAPETPVAALPVDENRIVCSGTINLYNYDEVIALQGSPDPNEPWSDKTEMFRLIVLDAPQVMTINSSDPSSGLGATTVKMIDVSSVQGLAQYDGQHHTFSIDPNRTYSPSDTSIPLGQPRTSDIRVLD